MAKQTKIGMVREELSRIARAEDRKDPVVPSMKASWSFTRMMVTGRLKMQTFDFDFLLEILKTIPDGAGEAQFWIDVDSMTPAKKEQESKPEFLAVQTLALQQTQEVQA